LLNSRGSSGIRKKRWQTTGCEPASVQERNEFIETGDRIQGENSNGTRGRETGEEMLGRGGKEPRGGKGGAAIKCRKVHKHSEKGSLLVVTWKQGMAEE